MKTACFLSLFLACLACMSQNFKEIEFGAYQSPINIADSECRIGNHTIRMHYNLSREHLIHDLHRVEVDYDSGSYVEFDREEYQLMQFHFHTPSEHLVNAYRYPVEMHIVHSSVRTRDFLVIALLFDYGDEDSFIGQFLNDVPVGMKHIDNDQKYLDINQELLPEIFFSYYYYQGSLTTPPYSENVNWIIDTRVHSCSKAQVDRLVMLEGYNHREEQKIFDREVEKVIKFNN